MDNSIQDQEKLITLVRMHYDLAQETEACIQTISQRWKDKINTTDSIMTIKQKLANSSKSLNTLTLRMPIVAAMKAGKSTIINALVGEDLLPARNEAMTVLPTEIRLMPNSMETCLKLTDQCVQTINAFYDNVKEKIRSVGDNHLEIIFKENARLILLAKEVLDFKLLPLKKMTTGPETIRKTLQFINDIVRITIHLYGKGNSVDFCAQFKGNHPVIEITYESVTPYEHKAEHILAVIDTPGPNESSERVSTLYEIVSDELKSGDLILVAIDYTKIGNSEDADIAAEIAAIHNILKEKKVDSVYALVNKVDQRRRTDRSPDEVNIYIQETYNISGSQVFELKAVQALAAKKYMNDFDHRQHQSLQETSLHENQLAQDLLHEIYHDQDDYNDALNWSPQALYDRSKRIYKNSGLGLFLEKTIHTVVINVLQRCVKICVDTCRLSSKILMGEIDMLYGPLTSSVSELENEITESKKEIQEVEESMRTQRQRIQTLLSEATQKIERIFDQVNQETEETLEKLFQDSNDIWQEPETWVSMMTKSSLGYQGAVAASLAATITGELVAIGGLELVVGTAAAVATLPVLATAAGVASVVGGLAVTVKGLHMAEQLDDIRNKTIQFSSDEEVKSYFGKISTTTQVMFNTIFCSSCQAVYDICRQIAAKYETELQSNTQELLSKAVKKQRRPYSPEAMELSPLKFSLGGHLAMDVSVQKRYRPLWGLGILQIETSSDQRWNMSHCISRVDVENCIKNVIRQHRRRMSTEIRQYIDDELVRACQKRFEGLNNYLKQYQKYLNGALENKKRSAKETKDVQETLKTLRIEVEKAKTLLNNFCNDTTLMRKSMKEQTDLYYCE